MTKAWWKSRTFWGALIYSAVRVGTAGASDRAPAILEAVGIVLGAVGLRGAIAKNGAGQ